MTQQITIRLATLDDVDAMFRLQQAGGTAAQWSRAQYQAIFDAQALPRLSLIAAADTPLGFLVAQSAGPEWELENIAVAPEARRQGIATRLLRSLLQHARRAGADAVVLEVRASNAAARALYRSCGFAQAGKRPRYYQAPGEDAVLYRCNLQHAL